MCRQLSLEAAYSAAIHQAAALHDIGKLTMPPGLWQKAAGLDAEERNAARQHTTRGHALLRRLGEPVADLVADAALFHHEAWDGSGYPQARVGEAIPFVGRLVGLCDVYSALREPRAYKPALSHDHAVHLMRQRDPTARVRRGMFDPHLLTTFMAAAPAVRSAYDSAESGKTADTLPGLRSTLQSARDVGAGLAGP